MLRPKFDNVIFSNVQSKPRKKGSKFYIIKFRRNQTMSGVLTCFPVKKIIRTQVNVVMCRTAQP